MDLTTTHKFEIRTIICALYIHTLKQKKKKKKKNMKRMYTIDNMCLVKFTLFVAIKEHFTVHEEYDGSCSHVKEPIR